MTSLFRAVLIVLVAFAASPALADKRVALVVGNAAYANAVPLANTINDAQAIAGSLEKLGFEVFSAYDAPQAGLLNTMAAFSDALEGADAAVFFYAGHGIQVGTENYILPVDIAIENELSVKYGALSLTDVLADIEQQAKVAIIILDACRNNPFTEALAKANPKRSAAFSRGLAPIESAGTGTIIAYAAAPGAVASDGEGDHSPYTAALLEEMEKPGVEVGLLFRRVAGRVIAETGGEQKPELLVRLASEYYFIDAAPEAVVAATPAVAAAAVENAPVDVAAVPSALPTTEDIRNALDLPDTRPALWDYAATLVGTPYDIPGPRWTAPEMRRVAEVEPNDSFGSAQLVQVNDTVDIALVSPGESDWLRFSVGQGGRLRVHTPTTPASVALAVRLVNANGDEMVYWTQAPRPGGELQVDFDLARPGSYSLQFAAGSSEQVSPELIPVALSYTVEEDVFEPNDRIDLAWHAPLNGQMPITLLPKGDRDWFKFTVTEPGALAVSLTNVPQGIDGTFRLLDANGTEIVYWIAAPRPGGETVATLDLPKPGVYYLDIADGYNDASDVASLTLSTSFAPSGDRLEPNDQMADAVAVKRDSRSAMAIFPRGDTDWVALDIEQPGELRLVVATPPEALDLTFRVVDSSGGELQYWQQAPRPGGDLTGSFDFGKPGRYYLQLADASNDASSVDPFELELAFTASLDAFEPNNTIGAAQPLTLGGEVPLTILPRGDADWYRVTVAEPGELKVWIENPPELDITYRVVNRDWTELAYWTAAYAKGGLTEGLVDLPLSGTYFIEVRDSGDDGRSVEPATLRTAFTPTANAYEPNNLFGEATPVDITGETVAHILPRGDRDWQVFYAPEAGTLDVAITGVPPEVDAAFHVLNADRSEIQYWIVAPRPGGDTTGSVTIPAAGWYWLEIADSYDDARSPLPFRVQRTFRPSE